MTNFKKLLLTGTAVVAMGAAPAFAQTAIDLDAATGTWASAGTQADDGTVEEAVAGADLEASVDSTLTVTNDTTADDGSADTNTFVLGDVTDADGTTLDVVVVNGAAAAPLTVTINSLATEGDLTVDSDAQATDLTITEASSIGGNLAIGTGGGAGATTVTATDGITVAGTTDVDATVAAASLTVGGDSEFTGGVTLTSGGVLEVDALTDGTDITIGGDIDGAGALDVNDADATTEDLVTFTGNIGSVTPLTIVTVGTDATGGGAQFDGTVAAADVAVGDTANTGNAFADFNDDLTTDLEIVASTGATTTSSVNVAGDLTGTVTLTDAADAFGTADVLFDGTEAQTISGAITTSAAGEGGVAVTNTSTDGVTFGADIGATGTGIDNFSIASGSTVNVANDIFVESDEAGDLNIDGTLNVDTSGAGVTIDDEGTAAVALDGTVIVTGANGLTLSGGSDAGAGLHAGWNDPAASLTTASTVTIDGEFIVGNSSDDRYTIVISDAAAGSVDGGGTSVLSVADGAVLNLGVTSDVTLDGTETVNFLTNFDAASTIDDLRADGAITLGNGLLTGTVTEDDSNLSVASLDTVDATTVAGYSSATAGAVNAILGLDGAALTADGGELGAARDRILNAGNVALANDEAEAISANVSGGAYTGAVSVITNSSLGITGERMASLRSGNQTGMAAGNMTHGLELWAKVFGTTGEQDDRDGVSGYDVDTYGVTVGMDTETLAEDWVWGVALTYADSEIDRTIGAAGSSDTDVDTYQFTVYGDYRWDAATYINTQLGYGMNSGDQTRTFGGGLVANADVDSDVFFARLETGRDYDMDNGFTLTPIAMLNYQHINPDSYTESGTCGAACLSVDTDSMNILEAGLGVEASYLHQNADGSYIKPLAHAAYRYDFIGDEVEATSSFAGAPAATFNTQGFDAQQNTFNVGAGLEFYSTANMKFSVNYDYEMKEDYDGHNGYVRAGVKF